MSLRLTISVFALFSCLISSAQLRINGLVEHEGHPLSDVVIKVQENGEVVQSISASRKGKYELEIAFNKKVTISFIRPFMFPVSMEVDTENSDRSESDVIYEVPLNMAMFYRYEGMNDRVFQESIGAIKKTGSGEQSFSFVPNVKVLESLKPLHQESLKREANEEEPYGTEVILAQSEIKEVESLEIIENPAGSVSKANPKRPSVENKSQSSEELDKPITRSFDAIEESKSFEQKTAQGNNQKRLDADSELALEEQKFIEDSKQIRTSLHEEDLKRQQALIASRVHKQESLLPAKGSVAENVQSVFPKAKLLKHTLTDGFFVSEEILLIEFSGKNHEYKKAVYNWVLFDVTYYTKDKDEISQIEYEKLKKQLDI